MIAPIALIGILVPSLVRDGVAAFSPPGISTSVIVALLTLVALLTMIWAQLAIVAIATDPATDAAAARRYAAARVLPAIGITAVLSIAAVALALPPLLVLIQAGFDFTAAASGKAMQVPPAAGAASLFTLLYFAVYLVAAIWVAARLILLNPVILNERLGVGALRRSIALTAGLTWRIIGVMILFAIAVLVSAGAAQSVTGIVFRLVLGADGLATAAFLAGAGATIVTTVFTALAAVFTARLYVAVREEPVPL